MLSISFIAKMPSLYSDKNSWSVGRIGISEQNLTKLLFYFTMIEQNSLDTLTTANAIID